jgi:hypothetical protein
MTESGDIPSLPVFRAIFGLNKWEIYMGKQVRYAAHTGVQIKHVLRCLLSASLEKTDSEYTGRKNKQYRYTILGPTRVTSSK